MHMMTKGEVDRLGVRIGDSMELSSTDLALLQEYRKSFHEPLSRVFAFVLKSARRIDRKCIVTYRIKRIDTIVEKVRRFRGSGNGRMQLSRMWDIAGCRCIFDASGNSKINQLKQMILSEYGPDCKVHDYIQTPQPSGYRSLHIYVKDEGTKKPIEIQIRNSEQHNWATLVEIVDLLYGTKNKEQGVCGKFGVFLSLYSNAGSLSDEQFHQMIRIERRAKIFEKMSSVLSANYLNIRSQWIKQNQSGCYYVITANQNRSEIVSFLTFREAEEVYFSKYLEHSDSNVVLTYIKNPDFSQISMAYSNYILAMHAFFDDYRDLLSDRIIDCVRYCHPCRFLSYSRVYNSNVKFYFGNMSKEVNRIGTCLGEPEIKRSQVNKWIKEIRNRLEQLRRKIRSFLNKLMASSDDNKLMRFLVINMHRRMNKAITDGLKLKKS